MEEREGLIRLIDRGWHVIAMEKFPADDTRSKDFCLERLQEADALVLILGSKYGSIEPKEGISYTEIEYNFAKSHDIPVFSFIKNINGRWSPEESDPTKREKLENFKRRVDESHLRKTFSSPEELNENVLFSLTQWEKKISASIITHDDTLLKENPGTVRKNDSYSTDLTISATQSQLSKQKKLVYSGSVQEIVSGEYNEQLKNIREIINDKSPNEGITRLNEFRSRVWDHASNNIKYEIESLHAIALHKLHEWEQAANLLIDALGYCPGEIKAIENAAYAYYILKNYPKCEELLDQVFSINQKSEKGQFISLSLLLKDNDIDDIIGTIPNEILENADVAQLIGRAYLNKSQFIESKKWLERSIENAKDTTFEIQGLLGIVHLQIVVSNPKTLNGLLLTEPDHSLLLQAVHLLSQSWDKIQDPTLQRIYREILLNRGLVYRLLKETTKFHQDIIEAYELDKSDLFSSYYRAVVAVEAGDYSCSERILSSPLTVGMPDEWRIIYTDQLRKQTRFDEALRIIESGLEIDTKNSDVLKRLQISIYLEKGDFDQAIILAQENYNKTPEIIQVRIDFINALRISKKKTVALTLLEETLKYHDLSTFEKVQLADEAYYLSSFSDAIKLYEAVADPSQQSEILERYTLALFSSKRLGKALSICKNLRETKGYLKLFVEIEYYIYQKLGDVDKAVELCKGYLEENPADFKMRYNYAVANLRNNNTIEADLFLSSLTSSDGLSVDNIDKISYLFLLREREEDAIDLLYEGIRQYPNEPKLQTQYISIFLKIDESDSEWFEPKRVGPNTVVFLRNQYDEKIHYIIENRADPLLDRCEIPITHQIAKDLNGKCLNESIDIPLSFLDHDTYRIEKIQSKYVYRFEDIYSNFSHRFVGEKGIQKIRLQQTSEPDDVPPVVIKAKELTQRHEEQKRGVQGIYRNSIVSLGGIAQIRNESVFSSWAAVTQDIEWGGISYSSDLSREQELAKIIPSPIIPKLIVDPIALMTITTLNIGDSIVKKFGKLGIAQSTVDELLDLLQTTKKKKEHISLGIQDGQLVQYPFTLDDKNRYCQNISQIINWVAENCDRIPSYRRLSTDGEILSQLEQRFGISTLDTILICDRPEYILLSDENGVRRIAKEYFKVESACTLTLLLSTKPGEENIFPEMTQIDSLIKLLILNYVPISFCAALIYRSCNIYGWDENQAPFKNVIELFEGNRIDYEKKVLLINLFIVSFWKMIQSEESKQWILFKFLNSMTTDESASLAIDNLRTTIYLSNYDIYLKQQLFDLINLWCGLYPERLPKEAVPILE